MSRVVRQSRAKYRSGAFTSRTRRGRPTEYWITWTSPSNPAKRWRWSANRAAARALWFRYSRGSTILLTAPLWVVVSVANVQLGVHCSAFTERIGVHRVYDRQKYRTLRYLFLPSTTKYVVYRVHRITFSSRYENSKTQNCVRFGLNWVEKIYQQIKISKRNNGILQNWRTGVRMVEYEMS